MFYVCSFPCVFHGRCSAGVRSIADAWDISAEDSVLHCLPLHHVHGVVNALATPLAMGAHVNMLPKFNAEQVLILVLACYTGISQSVVVSMSCAQLQLFVA